jgi:hypothetical protein
MHKKIDIHDLDIPADDIECWEKYPKHRWVYDMSRLLDAQGIKWSPFKTDVLQDQVVNMFLHSEKGVAYMPSWIYISNPTGKQVLSEVYIVKGEIKYVDNITKQVILEDVGGIELRISAFVSMHFQKFTGVVTSETIGTDIYAMRLRPIPELALTANTEVSKLIKRIYKKNDVVHINGLTDQQLHEVLAS